jgi:hypothetical protein
VIASPIVKGAEMDRDRFDALTRVFGKAGSRRALLGALAGSTLLVPGLAAEAKKHKAKKKGNKGKARAQSDRPDTCFGTRACAFPSDGRTLRACDLSGTEIASCDGCDFRYADLGFVDLTEGSFQGASFRDANLAGAFLDYSDVSGVSFRGACLVGADLFGANTDGADFRGAILCGTTMPDGSIDDSGCDNGTDCCPTTPCTPGTCPPGCEEADLVPGPGTACISDEGGCDFPCIKDAECPETWLCVDDGFCEFTHCHPPCSCEEVAVDRAGRGFHQ